MINLIKSMLLIVAVLAFGPASAHYLWVQTAETGDVGKAHEVSVYFGEYTYGVIEDPTGENFAGAKNFQLWAIAPSGDKVEIVTTAGEEAFVGEFTPSEIGTYTVVLNNDEIDVIDYTEYDFGIFKTHYHSTAKVVVGEELKDSHATNADGLVVINASDKNAELNGEVTLQIHYKGSPIEGQEVTIYVSDLWSKKLHTDANGEVSFMLPWATTYTIETTKKEEVPGSYKGEDYEFIWHCATYAIAL